MLRVLAFFFAAVSVDARVPDAAWITLGTGGGPVVQAKRSQPANAVIFGDDVYLFDVGEGTQRQMKIAGVPLRSVRAIFLSHHHLDHVGGLGPILINRWILATRRPVAVIGPPGTKEMVAGLVAAAQPVEQAPLAIGPTVRPIAETVVAADMPADFAQPREVFRDANIRILAVPVDHFHEADGSRSMRPSSYAFRIEAGGRTFVFTGDTGPSASLDRLAQNADILIAEVMDRAAISTVLKQTELAPDVRAGLLRHMDLNHLTPTEVGKLARRAGVKSVVLTHLVPGRDEETSEAGYVTGLEAQYRGPVRIARDGDRF